MEETLQSISERVTMLEKEIAQQAKQRRYFNGDCLTVEEVAEALCCSKDTVLRWENEGKLIPKFVEGKRKFAQEEVKRFALGYAPAAQAKRRAKARGISGKK